MQDQKGRQTKNSKRVQDYWRQELLYHKVLKDSLKPSVIMAELTEKGTQGVSNGGEESHVAAHAQEEATGKNPKLPGESDSNAQKTLKQHLLSDSESEEDLGAEITNPEKKMRFMTPQEELSGSNQDGGEYAAMEDGGGFNYTSPANVQAFPPDYSEHTPSYADFLEYRQFLAMSKEHARKQMMMTPMSPPQRERVEVDQLQPQKSPSQGDSTWVGKESEKEGSVHSKTAQVAAPEQEQTSSSEGEAKKGLKAQFKEEVESKEADTEFGPPVSDLLVQVVKKFVRSTKKQAKIEELMAGYKVPENMPFLQSPRIHRSVYLVAEQKGRDNDKDFRLMQSYTVSGMAALVRALDLIMEKEDEIPELVEIGQSLSDALRMFAFSSRDINMRRKDALRGYVDKKYGKLFAHSREIADDDLMGENVDELMKECDEDKRRQEKLTPSKGNKVGNNYRNQGAWGHTNEGYQTKFANRGRGSWERRKERRNNTDYQVQRNHGPPNSSPRGRGQNPAAGNSQAGFGNPNHRGNQHNQRGRSARGRY